MRCRIVSSQAALIALLSSAALALADSYEPDTPSSPTTVTPELQDALRELSNFNATRESMASPRTLLRMPAQTSDFNWDRAEKNDGSAAVTVKRPIALGWGVNVGADVGLPAQPALTYQADKPQQSKDPGSGAAWANVTVLPGLASFDARLDSGKEQTRLGTTFSRSVPLGTNYSITLQNSYAVTETLAGAPSASATSGPTGLPPSQVWTTDRLVKFNILSTGTSIAAGTTNSSADNVTRNKFSAEQKLFENFNITTSVTDVGSSTSNKSVTAGFKLKW
jgi:hypothetical protein